MLNGYMQGKTTVNIAGKTCSRPPGLKSDLLLLLQIVMVVWAAVLVQLAQASQPIREQEIAQCRPGEIATWGDGRDRPAISPSLVFVYDPAAAPAWFDEAAVLSALKKAAAAWSQCGVPGTVLSLNDPAVTNEAVPVRWSDKASLGNFGLANLTQPALTLGPAAFQLLNTRNPTYDARQTLQMVISHEMGHLYGLVAHSRRCIDVTSSYDNGKGELCFARDRSLLKTVPEYRSILPTACEIQRCRMLNGAALR